MLYPYENSVNLRHILDPSGSPGQAIRMKVIFLASSKSGEYDDKNIIQGVPKKRGPFVHHRKSTYIYPLFSTYYILLVDIPKKFSLEYGWLKQET